ncbi:MAG TPA: hypothetical protein PKJ83_01620 [Cyclobacteriaceae bacterium]|nr:hypothetical protein [Cyclobacteriaceae bacterium]HPW61053.1 hypothetical protein [Cyclobacteriaceae bacterium]
MRLIILIVIGTITISHPLYAQQKKKRSYPANTAKIENIKAVYSGCTYGPCYSWWSIVLKDNNELLKQSGGHYPPGARSRHFVIGTWQISADTLKLNIEKEFLNTEYMDSVYRIANLYDCSILLPIDNSKNWDVFLKDIQAKFEQTDNYKEWIQYKNAEGVISGLFSDFVSSEYSTDNKLLVSRTRY